MLSALAHTAKTMRGKHYSGFRDFDKVKEAGQQLHAELVAAGMFAEATTPTPETTDTADENAGGNEKTGQ